MEERIIKLETKEKSSKGMLSILDHFSLYGCFEDLGEEKSVSGPAEKGKLDQSISFLLS